MTAVGYLGNGLATTSAVGVVQLAGDLTGTATAPRIAAGAVTSAKIADGTIVDADLSSTAAVAASKLSGVLPVLRPEDAPFNASGLGVEDDTAAVYACFAAANALRKQVGTYADPGATVLLRGRYNLATLGVTYQTIPAICNVVNEGAFFTTPAGFTGTAFTVGHTTSGYSLRHAVVQAPNVNGATAATPGDLPVGGVGVLVRNIYSSYVTTAMISYAETLLRVGGESWGAAYNTIAIGTLTFGKVDIALKPLNASGWANQNTFVGGSTTGSVAWAGRRATGHYAVLCDGVGSTSVNGNSFLGVSFESDTYDYVFKFAGAYQNQFYGCRHEQGIAAVAVTVSGDTITSAAHVLAVGDMMMFTGTSAAFGMSFDQPYYVVEVPTADTFKVSASRGGSAITFTSAGTAVKYSRPQRVLYDANSYDNTIDMPMNPLRWLDKVYGTGVPAGLAGDIVRYPQQETMDSYCPPTWPLRRTRNRYAAGAVIRPALDAYYSDSVDPIQTPDGWTFASSATGPVWPGGVCITSGSGSPETVISAPTGSAYFDSSSGSWYRKASGTSNTGWLLHLPGGDFGSELLTAGEFVPSRSLVVSGSVTHTSGTQAMTFFTAQRTETITTLTLYTGTTAAAATPTLIRYGVWSIATNGDGTLVASTASDTTLLAAANTAYPVSLSSPWSKVAGRRYAVGHLVVSGATMPSFVGQVYTGTTVASLEFLDDSPRVTGRLTGQTDLANFADSSLTVVQQKTAVKLS